MLKIAIQAKGRLNEESMSLLADAGISAASGSRKLISKAKGFPMEILYLRDDDIPQAVAMGVADIGIVGLNEVAEKGEKVDEVMSLGFGACRISIAVPRETEYTDATWLNGRRVATSYPHILAKYFADNNISAEIHEIAGSVEIAPTVGMADAIFDIVSSGGTLIQNGLREVEQVFFSEAVLIATPSLPEEKLAEIDKLKFRLRSILDSRDMKYVLMNLPRTAVDEAVKILPGMKSPTLLPLTQPDWCSLHVVIPESELWEKIELLKNIGAEDILILNLENIIR
ncbi:MAG: ATP phosphoribosyltransferase [Duncaniella sp.]|jgi:ATP phosphoribosyltransferase|uniref:ATP phosphoribosyltransferase n=1 Tax=Duncaniella muricolitica TaxID=2880704 RepID=UPI00244DC85C|nr:ATP phosphoribosyltransferase [Duncaniella muricolitica]MCX4368731.1 ATP phosphoribosyltransferase [Duncaniella sp.]